MCTPVSVRNQDDFSPYGLSEVSVLTESPLKHLCCILTDVPPQPNSPPDRVLFLGHLTKVSLRKLLWQRD